MFFIYVSLSSHSFKGHTKKRPLPHLQSPPGHTRRHPGLITGSVLLLFDELREYFDRNILLSQHHQKLMNDSTCSCGDFQSNKFPCLHALAVCKKLKTNPLQYVDDCYTCERYYKTYAATFSPVPRLFPPVIPPPVVPCKSQRKTTPKTTNKRKS
ncbi:unnamed protein product [Brassica oleracea]|uniref:SWIM-type domain-containing protein n=2 Tax=Brassica TaxID=3705 RepID=A0A0D3ALB1_BRAOL|nr:unnamed protein product [Brassica napus]